MVDKNNPNTFTMTITFTSLNSSHFPLLLKWLEEPHVKAWWDRDICWTLDLVAQKYASYVLGYKIQNEVPKPIIPLIINVDNKPVGYLQIYNAYDFPRDIPLQELPAELTAFDIFIGETDYLGKGIATEVLDQYFHDHPKPIFVDPDQNNLIAIRVYEKVGFKKIKEWPQQKIVWMIRKPKTRNESR